ncbi:MAG: oxygen-independent coproporphyrinogen III oxidase [Rhodospirillales bacterium]|nr:oxygen-independent coproporphyrinogen III oxidase [Rhodospirillales bacterium]
MRCNLRETMLKLDRPVPRYTSYPTAPHFQPLEDEQLYPQMLADLPEGARLSLYLHVPFCPKMCWYCGCHTKVTQRYAPVEDYAHLMMREIEILADALGSRGHKISHIHFGGGSPGMLRARDFAFVMDRVRENFTVEAGAEIAIEIDPRELTEGRVAAYAKNGVNRISLGVQDFDNTVLESVNRPQPFELSAQAVEWFRAQGIERINMDLLYGLPHQSPETMVATIEKAISLNPDRLALFGYAHVPWMKKHMRLIDENALPDKTMRFDLFEAGAQTLEHAGYIPVGIDHFAKKDDALVRASKEGRLRRNFQGYTDDAADALIGIGASSIGFLPGGYVQNAVDMPVYRERVLAGKLTVAKYCPIDDEDRLHAGVIERLMCDFGVDVGAQCAAYGFAQEHLDSEIEAVVRYADLGFIEIDGRRLKMNPKARMMVRIIASVFDAYIPNVDALAPQRHSKAI